MTTKEKAAQAGAGTAETIAHSNTDYTPTPVSSKEQDWAVVQHTRFYCLTPEKAATVRKRITLDEAGRRKNLPVKGFWHGVAKRVACSLSEMADWLAPEKPSNEKFAFLTAGVHAEEKVRMGSWEGRRRQRSKKEFPHPIMDAMLTVDSDELSTWPALKTPDDVRKALGELGLDSDCITSTSASSYLDWFIDATALKGLHTFYPIDQGTEIPRVLEVTFKRACLAGYIRILVGDNGVLHVRSLVDLALKSSNQCIFEFGAILKHDEITQHRKVQLHRGVRRQLVASEIKDLTEAEEAEFRRLVDAEKAKYHEAAKAQTENWLDRNTAKLPEAERPAARKKLLEMREAKHRDLPHYFMLTLNDGTHVSVADVLADPEKWHYESIRDPLEPEYGPAKATIFVKGQTNGKTKVISMAHGEPVVYYLFSEPATAASVIAILRTMTSDEILDSWVELALPLSNSEAQEVVEEVARRAGRGKQPLKQDLNRARRDAQVAERRQHFHDRIGGRLMIEYRPEDRTEQARQVEQAIVDSATPGEYVVFGGVLSHVAMDRLPFTHRIDADEEEAPPVPQIKPLGKVAVLARVERVAVFCEMSAEGVPAAIAVPDKIVDILIEKDDHCAPQVLGLLTHPTVLPSGGIAAKDGLHDSGLFISGASIHNARPYRQDEAKEALTRLHQVFLEGFEFATELDRDAAIAGLFTGVQRRLLDSAPGLCVIASTQSSGKTTLARRIHVVLTGQDMPVTNFPLGDEPEVQKRLLAMLLRSPAMVCFDNLADGVTFRSAAVAAAMTSPYIEQRVLGLSREARCPTNTLFVATGNNLGLGRDEVSRWLVCRLEPNTLRPEQRTFKHPDVVPHAMRMRESVLRDVVGIIAGYLAGPRITAVRGTRFHQWDTMVRLPLMWAGGQDLAEVFEQNTTKSDATLAHELLLSTLMRIFIGPKEEQEKFYARDVAKIAGGESFGVSEDDSEKILDALERLGAKNARSSKSVGRVLMGLVGRQCLIGPEEQRVAVSLIKDISGGEIRYEVSVSG